MKAIDLNVTLERKNRLAKETKDLVEHLKTEAATSKHEASMSKEVEEQQRKRLDELLTDKERINKALMLKVKENKVFVKEIETLRENVRIINKDNSDLKIQLNVKRDLVKGLKEALSAKDPEIVEVSASNVIMTKGPSAHECNACDKKFKTSSNLEDHVNAKHTEKPCIYCDKICNNDTDLIIHHKECADKVFVAESPCSKCNQVFTINGLKRHESNCHVPNKDFDCQVCGKIANSESDLNKHQDQEHKMEQVKSRVVCKHYRRGNCFKGDSCGFSHVGKQNKSSSSTNKTNTRVPSCKNGPTCEWLIKGNCSYFHPRVGVQRPWVNKEGQGGRQEATRPSGGQGGHQGGYQEAARPSERQGGRQETQPHKRSQGQHSRARTLQPDREQCKFDGRCERIPNCPFIHSLEDFPIFQGRRAPAIRKNLNQRKN